MCDPESLIIMHLHSFVWCVDDDSEFAKYFVIQHHIVGLVVGEISLFITEMSCDAENGYSPSLTWNLILDFNTHS